MSAIAGAASYHVIAKIPVPGDYGWDYASADSEGRRLYVGHDEEVVVIDLDSTKIMGSIGGGSDMHGAAVAREFGRGFISESNPGSVVIFDLKTMKKIATNKLRGALTPRVVLEHLKSHPAFEDFIDRLTPASIVSRVKGMNAALTAKGFDPLPEFEIRQKRNVEALGAALAEDEDEE